MSLKTWTQEAKATGKTAAGMATIRAAFPFVVVGADGAPDLAKTKAMQERYGLTAPPRMRWYEDDVRPVDQAFAADEGTAYTHDPLGGEPFSALGSAGRHLETLAARAGQGVPGDVLLTLALAAQDAEVGPDLVALTMLQRKGLYTALALGGQPIEWAAVLDAATVRKPTEEATLAAKRLLREGKAAPVARPEEAPRASLAATPRAAVQDMLLAMCGEHDLRALGSGLGVANALPGSGTSPSVLAAELVRTLERYGLMGRLWPALEELRPRRVAEIRAVRTRWEAS